MKFLGCVLFFIGSAGIGGYASHQLERRKRQLVTLRKAILSMSREIDYCLSPLSDALQSTANRAEEPWKEFFYGMGQLMEDRTVCERKKSDIMKKEIKKLEKYHPWKKDLAVLQSLLKGLGQLDKAMQLAQLELAQEEIIQAEKEASEEYKVKSQLYKSLGICMGVLGVIIFI